MKKGGMNEFCIGYCALSQKYISETQACHKYISICIFCCVYVFSHILILTCLISCDIWKDII